MIRVKNPNYVDRLPDEYQEVRYLESTGTQYIDTGYFPNGNMKYELEIKNSSATGVLFGAYNTTWTDGNGFYTNIANTSNQYDYKHYASNVKIAERISSADMILIMDKGKIFIDGIQYHSHETISFNVTKSLYIYAGNMNGAVEQPTKYQLYYFKMYDNDILVRNFIPCYRKSDNIPGLYDLVNNVFYTNAGTGTFLVGKDINKKDVNIKPIHNGKILKNRYVGGKLVYGEPLMNYEYRFVTVGENGQSYYSTDGETWNPMTGATKTLNSVTYGNDRFIAVGDSGKSYYSIDGETWTSMGTMPGSSLTGNNYYSVAYGNNHFVAVGDSGLICYSTDGETWTSATGQTTGVFAYKEVIYAKDRFVVVGESSAGSYSLNGETWTSMKGLANEMHYGLTYGNDMFVCSSGPIISSHSSYYCKDGINWIEGGTILSGNVGVQDLAYGNGIFVAVGGNGKSAYSTDGINWTNVTFSSGTFYGITFANNKFICVGNSGYSFYSSDGINWTAMSGLSSNIFYNVSYQRKAVEKYKQLINYTMLYDYGDECTDITGGWTGGKYITNYSSAGTYTKYDTYMYCKSGTSSSLVSAGFYTVNQINMSDYSKAVFNISQLDPSYVAYIAVDTVQVNAAWTQTVGKRFDTNENQHPAGLHSLDVSTLTSDLYVKFGCWAYASMIAVDLVFLVKQDNWQTLYDMVGLGSDQYDETTYLPTDDITNAEVILNSEEAVDFMIHNCTGSFMIDAINNDNFLTALSNSPYKTKIYANEHWNKFLAIVA